MSESELQPLIGERKQLRKRISVAFSKRAEIANMPEIECFENLRIFSEYSSSLKNINSRIDNITDIVISDDEYSLRLDYENKLLSCIANIEYKLGSNGQPRNDDSARTLLRSPTAPLPKFSSCEGEDLSRFLIEFEDTIGKFTFSDYDKLLLLKQQVSGRALTLINSLESDKLGYKYAKELLTEALASPDIQICDSIRQITELKLKSNTDPFEYISKVRLLTESIRKLKISEEHFLQYFVWRGLNECFQDQLIHITNSTRPSYDEIMSNFFKAAERYTKIQKKSKFEDSSCFASKVNYSQPKPDMSERSVGNIKCSICIASKENDINHFTIKCPKFKTVESKVELLKSVGGCIKCGYLNHKSDSCRYKFQTKCDRCNGWHRNYLCMKAASVGSSKVTNVSNNVIVITDSLRSTISNNSLLPTFSCYVNDYSVRCLKDSGSQANFICESLADSLKLKVIDEDIFLNVNGINSTQSYRSKLVNVPLSLNGKIHNVEALCIPSINVDLKIDGLGKVVSEFTSRGYELADSFLTNRSSTIDNIQFILGTKGGYCLPERETSFGIDNFSVFSYTSCGVLLRGDIEQMLRDIDHLPYLSKSSNETIKFNSLSESRGTIINSFTALCSQYDIINDDEALSLEISKASDEILKGCCDYQLNYDPPANDTNSILNDKLADYALKNLKLKDDNRIVMPLLWNGDVAHLLGKNKNLAQQVLYSNLKKLKKNPELLKLMDQTFREQEDNGIIERILDIETFEKENPAHSYLPHMGVFKLKRETTKCRIVYLSNLCEKSKSQKMTISHNQAIHCGPSLNQKLSSSLLHLKFDQNLLCFDIAKAFNCLALNEIDQNRLLLYWFRDVNKGDFTLVPYKHVRLSFGLRCSPTLLMLSLFWLLIINVEEDDSDLRYLKSLIYQLAYMDNLAVSSEDHYTLVKYYRSLKGIFETYGFPLQQFVTNDDKLQGYIDQELSQESSNSVKLLGLQWNKSEDLLSTKPINLNKEACSKREVLSSIASQFDILNYNTPLINRARLFLHKLQCDSEILWDSKLDPTLLREWKNICKQANSAPPVEIERFVGSRDGSFRLLAFSDSSQSIYGAVIYIQDLQSNNINFLMSKSKIVNKSLESKSIPSLEMQGIVLATECMFDIYDNLSGDACVVPINIKEMIVYSDSLVCLSWINSSFHKLDKLQKYSIFVQNRIQRLNELTSRFPVCYKFVSGCDNPADCVTRCLSHKQLSKTCYISGPEFIKNPVYSQSRDDILSVIVPSPLIESSYLAIDNNRSDNLYCDLSYSDNLIKCSSYKKLRNIYANVFKFINILKIKLKNKDSDRYKQYKVEDVGYNFLREASNFLLEKDQLSNYKDILDYFNSSSRNVKDIPDIVSRLNIFIDKNGLLRVRSKFGRFTDGKFGIFPLLLAKNSKLTNLIIDETHRTMMHSGVYSILNHLRQIYWIPHCFSVVKKVIKSCVQCRKFNAKPILLNQNSYREIRVDPSQIPFSNIYVDYIGPFYAKVSGEKSKLYLLCITCMFTRAVNLKISYDLSVKEYLRSFQLHCFEYGVPTHVISDLGTQLVAGANIIRDFLKDCETQRYLEEFNIKTITFEHYYKGHSELGSLVESCVKLVKRLIYGAIRNNIVDCRDFEYIICQTVHLVNRRPISFKESLRDCSGSELPCAITPENLLRGYDLISLNINPELQPHDELDPDWKVSSNTSLNDSYSTLRKLRASLLERYHNDFLVNLINQAVSVKDRYKPISHKALNVGDVVIIKEPNTKLNNYPMGIVKDLQVNDCNEVTGATIFKGSTRELVKRHSSTIIPILSVNNEDDLDRLDEVDQDVVSSRKQRSSALKSRELTKLMLADM